MARIPRKHRYAAFGGFGLQVSWLGLFVVVCVGGGRVTEDSEMAEGMVWKTGPRKWRKLESLLSAFSCVEGGRVTNERQWDDGGRRKKRDGVKNRKVKMKAIRNVAIRILLAVISFFFVFLFNFCDVLLPPFIFFLFLLIFPSLFPPFQPLCPLFLLILVLLCVTSFSFLFCFTQGHIWSESRFKIILGAIPLHTATANGKYYL